MTRAAICLAAALLGNTIFSEMPPSLPEVFFGEAGAFTEYTNATTDCSIKLPRKPAGFSEAQLRFRNATNLPNTSLLYNIEMVREIEATDIKQSAEAMYSLQTNLFRLLWNCERVQKPPTTLSEYASRHEKIDIQQWNADFSISKKSGSGRSVCKIVFHSPLCASGHKPMCDDFAEPDLVEIPRERLEKFDFGNRHGYLTTSTFAVATNDVIFLRTVTSNNVAYACANKMFFDMTFDRCRLFRVSILREVDKCDAEKAFGEIDARLREIHGSPVMHQKEREAKGIAFSHVPVTIISNRYEISTSKIRIAVTITADEFGSSAKYPLCIERESD